MTRFQDVLRPNREIPVQNQQEAADARLPALAESVGFRMWKPGDQIPEHGRRVLVGVATYSPVDMELLDKLSEVSTKTAGSPVVDLFNVRDVHGMDDFDAFVPGIGQVFQTPVAGFWDNGRLVEKASGSQARRLVMQWVTNDNGSLPRAPQPFEREGAGTPTRHLASAKPAAHHAGTDAPKTSR